MFISLKISTAQDSEPGDICGTTELTYGKLHIPTSTPEDGQYLRVLIIYVTFPDDNEEGQEGVCIWKKPYGITGGTRPLNPHTQNHNLIASGEASSGISHMTRYEQYTISDYFCQMSGGQFDVIGDEVYFKLPLNSTDYQSIEWRQQELNAYILQYAKWQFPNINFANYDNWHKEGNNWVWGGDGEAEMIVIHIRKLPGDYESYYWQSTSPPGGMAYLFGNSNNTVTLDGVLMTTNDGVTVTQGLYRTTRLELLIEHEISHHIFGAEFNHIGFNHAHVSIGMMTEFHSTSTYCMTPMERSMNFQLDWMVPYETNQSQNLWSFNLEDEFESGDAVKVWIPKANINDPQEYLWITNHQKKSRYDGISRGSNTCYQINQSEMDPFCDIGKGLYIFHESDKNCPNNINGWNNAPLIQNWRHYAFDLKNASGRWNWGFDTLVVVPEFIVPGVNNGEFKIWKTISRNITTGISEYYKYYLIPYPDWSAQLLNRDLCWNPPNYKITADFHGDGKDAFNVEYNNILSPYSNSSSNNYENPSFNTGLTIYLIAQDPESKNIHVQICYNDDYAQTHYPPSKPQNLKVTPLFATPGVSYYPKLNWEQNLEPGFSNSGTYKIYRAGPTYYCSTDPLYYTYITTVSGSTLEFVDYSTLLYNGDSGSDNCPTILQNVHYKITANMNGKESVKSERGLIQGYLMQCIFDPGAGNDGLDYKHPKSFELKQNYPNPFNPITNIKYDLQGDVIVNIKIYDITGREIKTLVNEFKPAGSYIVSFNGSEFASGIYFYKIQAGNFVQVKRMILIK